MQLQGCGYVLRGYGVLGCRDTGLGMWVVGVGDIGMQGYKDVSVGCRDTGM